jgi:hypothetical protein
VGQLCGIGRVVGGFPGADDQVLAVGIEAP